MHHCILLDLSINWCLLIECFCCIYLLYRMTFMVHWGLQYVYIGTHTKLPQKSIPSCVSHYKAMCPSSHLQRKVRTKGPVCFWLAVRDDFIIPVGRYIYCCLVYFDVFGNIIHVTFLLPAAHGMKLTERNRRADRERLSETDTEGQTQGS